MAFSTTAAAAAFHCRGAPSSYAPAPTKLCYSRLNWGDRVFVVGGTQRRNIKILRKIRSVIDNPKLNIGSSDNEALEPARILLERLLQAQKLEEHMNKNSQLSENENFCLNLEVLESDLQVALTAMRKKENYLQSVEKKVLQDHTELETANHELERTKQEVASAYARHEKMEEELKKASDELFSQARQIEDLKHLVEERDQELKSSRSALSVKEGELHRLRNELVVKEDEAAQTLTDLNSRDQLLLEANQIIRNQEVKLQELRRLLKEKEHELAESSELRKNEEQKLKLAETNLEKCTVEWLSSKEELMTLVEEVSKNMAETKETMRYFIKVRSLLADVRSELIYSQKSLISCRSKMEEQGELLQNQMMEVNELKLAVTSYTTSLRVAQLELESERNKLKIEEARGEELEEQLHAEREMVRLLEEELNKERSSVEVATRAKVLLQKELEQKSQEFREIQNILQFKESELVGARLEIQHLKSRLASFELSLKEKDITLFSAQKKLEEVNCEVSELKKLMTSREEQLVQATENLKDEETSLLMVQRQLDHTNVTYSEATSMVERIAQLTSQLVISTRDETENYDLEYLEEEIPFPSKSEQQLQRENQLQLQLATTKNLLSIKEREIMAAVRALACKDEELRAAVERLDMQEKEIIEAEEQTQEQMQEQMDGHINLYKLGQERIGEKAIAHPATEKLQLEAARLEVEAAMTALRDLTNTTLELLKQADVFLNLDANSDAGILLKEEEFKGLKMDSILKLVRKEVIHLSAMTERFVRESGIVSTID